MSGATLPRLLLQHGRARRRRARFRVKLNSQLRLCVWGGWWQAVVRSEARVAEGEVRRAQDVKEGVGGRGGRYRLSQWRQSTFWIAT